MVKLGVKIRVWGRDVPRIPYSTYGGERQTDTHRQRIERQRGEKRAKEGGRDRQAEREKY